MNQIQAIKRINEQELEAGGTASWHDQYKDSAYVNVGGLPYNLTEGDVITIFSQYGEVVDINMPRDPQTGKPRGFAWLMYMDQRSTILAVDNLNGAQVLGRSLRVDHVLDYKQLERDQETGKMKEREEQSLAAHPEKFLKTASGAGSDYDSDSSHGSIDLDDPMRDYLIEQKRAAKKRRIGSGEGGESKEERKRARAEKRKEREAKRAEKERRKGGKAIEGGAGGRDRREDDDRRRRDERPTRREDSPGRRREYSPRRGEERRRDPRDDERRRGDDYEDRRRRDDYDDRRREDRDRERDYRRRDERDDRRGGGGRPGSHAFADLEKWVKG
ncbi:hypothetical protein JCM8097_003546 [Rhodosporidiobolus ruineniae]